MTVSGMKRSSDDMQVDTDIFSSQAGTSIIATINECVKQFEDLSVVMYLILVFFSLVPPNASLTAVSIPRLKLLLFWVLLIFPWKIWKRTC